MKAAMRLVVFADSPRNVRRLVSTMTVPRIYPLTIVIDNAARAAVC
jgi:hypothetical protein